jgi:hypothetical protein
VAFTPTSLHRASASRGRREHAARREARLEDDVRVRAERLRSGLDALGDPPRLELDEHPAHEALPRELADAVAAVEHGLEPVVGPELRRLRLVDLPPEPPQAPQADAEARLRDVARYCHRA